MTDIGIEAIPGFRRVSRHPHDPVDVTPDSGFPPALDAGPSFGDADESPGSLQTNGRDTDPDARRRLTDRMAAAASSERNEPEPTLRDEPPSRAEVEFGVHVSMRYHARRRAWYDRLHRAAMLVLSLGGSGAAVAILGGLAEMAETLSLAVAAAGALELAFSFPEKARIEDALYRRFSALASNMAAVERAAPGEIEEWNARRLLISADADDRLEALRRVCHNLEAEACGYGNGTLYPLKSWQRLFAQVMTLPPLRPMGWC